MVTMIRMERIKLITKEAMEKYTKGEEARKDSVNDDLESLFEDLRLGKEPKKKVYTYFLPKLTEEEMELVEQKDTNYFQTFNWPNPDVPEAEMLLSESDSKFLQGWGGRKTFTIDLENEDAAPPNKKVKIDKNSSEENIFNCCNLQ